MPLLPSFLPSSSPLRQDDEFARQQAAQLAPPPICLTGAMCQESSLVVSRTLSCGTQVDCTIRYLVFRPRQLRDTTRPPLLVLHGGPSVPSNYLFPLVHLVTDRAIVFYDQVGCGRSSRPSDLVAYNIDLCVSDLRELIRTLEITAFHLHGHSFGGILAFEYLKSTAETKNLSLVLSSTPTSIALAEEESKTLLDAIKAETGDEPRQCLDTFRQLHECRVVPIPLPLLDAYSQAGSAWRGTKAIPDYVASGDATTTKLPPALVLRGQFDFITNRCIEGWKAIFDQCQTVVLAGCSHHGLLENEELYRDVIHSFLINNDPQTEPPNQQQEEEVQQHLPLASKPQKNDD